MSDQGTGLGFAFDSGYFATIISFAHNDITRQDIDVTLLSHTDAKRFVPSDLYDPGGIDVEMLFPPGTTPPIISNTQETGTVTYTDSGAATWAGSAYMNGLSITAVIDDRVKANGTLKMTGPLTITP